MVRYGMLGQNQLHWWVYMLHPHWKRIRSPGFWSCFINQSSPVNGYLTWTSTVAYQTYSYHHGIFGVISSFDISTWKKSEKPNSKTYLLKPPSLRWKNQLTNSWPTWPTKVGRKPSEKKNTRPGWHTKSKLENGPVEIVGFPINSMVDLSIVMLVYQRVLYQENPGKTTSSAILKIEKRRPR